MANQQEKVTTLCRSLRELLNTNSKGRLFAAKNLVYIEVVMGMAYADVGDERAWRLADEIWAATRPRRFVNMVGYLVEHLEGELNLAEPTGSVLEEIGERLNQVAELIRDYPAIVCAVS